MSQHDFEIANQGFPSFRSDLNSGLQALASNSAGATEPSTTYAYQFWYDSTANLLKMRNTDDDAWITLAYFDQTNDEWEVRSAVIQAVDSAGVTIKTDEGTARITVADNGNVTIANQLTVSDGLVVDNDGATVATFDRATSDGTIAEFQKDGTKVGAITSRSGVVSSIVLDSRTGGHGLTANGTGIHPADENGDTKDDDTDLGESTTRFKDLYLSGGVYLGGTGAANYLDDYEEGTWTPVFADASSGGNTAPSYGTQEGRYVKIGKTVYVYGYLYNISTTGLTSGNNVYIRGLPFTVESDGTTFPQLNISFDNVTFSGFVTWQVNSNTTASRLRESLSGSANDSLTVSQFPSGNNEIIMNGVYEVD